MIDQSQSLIESIVSRDCLMIVLLLIYYFRDVLLAHLSRISGRNLSVVCHQCHWRHCQCKFFTFSLTQPLCNEESVLFVIVSSDLKKCQYIHSCTASKLKHKVVLDNEELHVTWVISIFQQQIYCLKL